MLTMLRLGRRRASPGSLATGMQDGLQVGAQERVPGLGGAVGEGAAECAADDVHQRVEPPPSFGGRGEERVECLWLASIADVHDGVRRAGRAHR
jgi:hypothetical protein